MRRLLVIVLVALATALLGNQQLVACGDKLLFVGRGTPYSRAYAAKYPAAVLIYVPSTRKGAGSELASILRRAGHDAQIATDRPQLDAALASRQVDVVVAGLDTISAADGPRDNDHPQLVPLLGNSKSQRDAAIKRYPFAVPEDKGPNGLLATIDAAMTSRPSHATTKKH